MIDDLPSYSVDVIELRQSRTKAQRRVLRRLINDKEVRTERQVLSCQLNWKPQTSTRTQHEHPANCSAEEDQIFGKPKYMYLVHLNASFAVQPILVIWP